MYENLRVEMVRKNLNISRLAEKSGIPFQRLSGKLHGRDKKGFLFSEAVSIKTALGTTMPLEVLFER